MSFERGDCVDEASKVIGRVLRTYRKKQKLSQEVVSGLAGIDRNLYSKIERGEKALTVLMLFLFAEVLRVSPHTLLTAIEEELKISGVFTA